MLIGAGLPLILTAVRAKKDVEMIIPKLPAFEPFLSNIVCRKHYRVSSDLEDRV